MSKKNLLDMFFSLKNNFLFLQTIVNNIISHVMINIIKKLLLCSIV